MTKANKRKKAVQRRQTRMRLTINQRRRIVNKMKSKYAKAKVLKLKSTGRWCMNLSRKQRALDVNRNCRIDGGDFKKMRKLKKKLNRA